MQKMLSLAVGLAALTLSCVASAQFDGPAPLAWRWQQSSTSIPGGSPVVSGNTIYQSLGGRVYSLDKDSGNLIWRFPAVDPINGAFRSAPVLTQGVLVAASDNKLAMGVDPTTGQLKWSYPTPSAVYGQPVAVGKLVILALSDNTLLALNPVDGTPAWTAPYHIFEGIQGTMGVHGSSVLICTNTAKLISFNVDSQKMDWTRTFEQLPPSPTPVVQDDRVFITSGTFLIALNALSGLPIWQVDTRMELAFAPACSGSGILVVSVEGDIALYDLNHQLVTKKAINLGSSPVTRPTPVGNKFIVPTSNGGMVLLDPASGKVLWYYVIHPIDEFQKEAVPKTNGSGGGPGKGGGGGPGLGAGGGGGFGGQGGPGGQTKKDDKVYFIQASSPAVLAGQTLLVPARDGSLLAFDKDLGVDLTPPTVKMEFPNPGEAVCGLPPLVLLFKVEDEASGLNKDSLKISGDNQDWAYTFTKEGLVLVRFSSSGANKSLADGRRTFIVTASDWMGNESKTEVSLMIDNLLPPIILPGQEPKQNGVGGPGGKGGGGFGGGPGGFGGGR